MISDDKPIKWLFVTSQFPWPLAHGQWLRVYHLARLLRRQGDEVSILTCATNAVAAEVTEEGIAAYRQLGIKIIDGPKGGHRTRGRSRTFFGPYAFDQHVAQAVARHSSSMDAVVLSHSRMLQYSPEAASSGCVIADIGDDPVLEYGRRRDGAASIQNSLWRMKARYGRLRYERQGMDCVSVATFVSDADAKSFGQRHPDGRTVCVSNGVDADFFQRPHDFVGNSRPATLVFTGNMGNPNNRWAAEYLVRSVAPLVWSKMQDVRVQIVGADPSEEVRALADQRVEVTGTVPDIRPYLWNASLVTLPMQTGTGIKNKLLEAWAATAPVVATPLACQGVDARDGENIAVASTAEQFAAKVIELLSDERQRDRMATHGRRTVEHGFIWEAAANRLRELVHSRTFV